MRKFEYRGCFAQVWTQCWDASPEVVAWLKAHNQSNAEAVFELLNVTHSAAAAAGRKVLHCECDNHQAADLISGTFSHDLTHCWLSATDQEVWEDFGDLLPSDSTIVQVWSSVIVLTFGKKTANRCVL